MNSRITRIAWIAAALASMYACSRDIAVVEPSVPVESEEPASEIIEEGVQAVIATPVCGDGSESKAISDAFKFSFADGDEVNVMFGTSSKEIMTYGLKPDSNNPKSAKFDVENFTLNDGTYLSIYPAQTISTGSASLNLSFAGQSQSENGSSSHLAAYDYSVAQADIANNSGTFSYGHKVSWIKVTIPVTDAANFKSLTISADEGVANSATLTFADGTVTPSRSAGDVLTLSLGGDTGIDVAANGTLTAFVTVPSDSYTKLTISATDALGYVYKRCNTPLVTLGAGKYYTMALIKQDAPAFTSLTDFGAYTYVNTNPTSLIAFDEDKFQMSTGGGTDFISFKIADIETAEYAIFNVAASSITVDNDYTVTTVVNGTKSEGTFTAVQKTDDCVWFVEKIKGTTGIIIAIE